MPPTMGYHAGVEAEHGPLGIQALDRDADEPHSLAFGGGGESFSRCDCRIISPYFSRQ
jgi:hypothetical protein